MLALSEDSKQNGVMVRPGELKPREKPRAHVLNALLIIVVATAAYLNSLPNEFVWDDVGLVANNSLIRHLENLPRILVSDYWELGDGTPYTRGNYRPLTVVSLLLNYQVSGLSPAGFRGINVGLHATNSLGVWILGLLLGLTINQATVAGLLFGLHPVHTEAVVWITGRAELLACTFVLSSLCLFILYQRSRRFWFLAGSILLFSFGLLSKESAISLLLLLPAVQLLRLGSGMPSGPRSELLQLSPFMALALVYLALRFAVLGTLSQVSGSQGSFLLGRSPSEVFLIMVQVLAYYMVLLVFPLRLSAHYDTNDFPVPQTVLEPPFVSALAVHLILWSAILWSYRKGHYALTFALFWVPVSLLPYSQIVRFEWLMAERFLYIPSVGFVLSASILVSAFLQHLRLAGRQRSIVGVLSLMIVLALFGVKTVHRNRVWRDELTFFGRLASDKPWVAGLRMKNGDALMRDQRYQEAIFEYEEALRFWPEIPGVRERLRLVRQLQGTAP